MLAILSSRATLVGAALRRALSTKADTRATLQQLEQDRGELLDFFPRIVEDTKDITRSMGIPSETEWLGKVMEYNVPHGGLVRGCSVLNACREMIPDYNPREVKVLAWAMEMIQGAYLILDDVCDGGLTRRGRPSWYTLPDVKLGAVNDAYLLESASLMLLRRHLRDHPAYVPVIERLIQSTFYSLMGQNGDVHTMLDGKPQIDTFTLEHFKQIALYKTSYYSFFVPISVSMYMAGITDPRKHADVWNIAADIGILFTVQDDFRDVYQSEETSGKLSLGDIRNGKCTWIFVEAKRRADPRQLAVLKENYGVDDAEKAAEVKSLFHELGMHEATMEYQRSAFASICQRIERQDAVPAATLHYMLHNIKHHVPQE